MRVVRAGKLVLLLGSLGASGSLVTPGAGRVVRAPAPFDLPTKRFDVDVDGAPNAYGPKGKPTLDDLRNAHYRGRKNGPIVGYLTEDDHPDVPVVQGPHDPFPGYYVSQTAFLDRTRPRESDPLRYVDATKINYVVRGTAARRRGVQLGDFVAVHSWRTGRTVFGIVGDEGNPSGDEGSLHLLQDLGYPFHWGRDEAVEDPGEITVRFFPRSNPQQVFFHTQAALDAAARVLGLDGRFTQPTSPGAHPRKR